MKWFDFNLDGKTSINEQWIAYNIFKECTREDEDNDDDILLLGGVDNSWRDNCEDGTEFDVDPEDYETEEEYEEALEEAKYAWRDDCEDGTEFDVDPEDYETEEEYEEALEEAKYAWRDDCEDGTEFDVNPEDYEIEEEYEEALEEAKYAWRDDCEDGTEFDVVPEDYETEDEYEEALDEARNKDSECAVVREYDYSKEKHYWRRKYLRTETYGLNTRDFENERDFRHALENAREDALKIAINDKTIYHYCAVVYEGNSFPYHYRTYDESLKIGDKVIVPVGPDNRKEVAEVVSVEQHTRISVPYSVEKVKCIIGKLEN